MANEPIYYQTIPPRMIAKYATVAVVVMVVLSLLTTTFYQVNTDEKGVVQRFGKFVRVEDAGLCLKIPMGIETVKKIPVTRVFIEEFGFRTLKAGIESKFRTKGYESESLMLCGDLSVADVSWSVKYKIAKPKDYIFNVRNPQKIIRDAAESVMRSAIGDSSVDEVLSERRSEINNEAKENMQRILDSYGTGVIVEVTLQEVTPPSAVKSAFNEVNIAQQDKERLKKEAEKEYNTVVFKADGQAKQMKQQAQAYAVERVNEASGDANRFTQIWQEYSQSKDVTRRRLYLE
ncbi:MAG TPA: FtsH protease activity modulator HflK, partial [Phycisphaerales bacterium]|nr:FtsH protease activity modulator HflK [Phycisphaerales bacterium]